MAGDSLFGPYDGREQALIKHSVLRRYLEAFVPIVGDWARDIAYIDCYAGPWESATPDYSDTSFGIAISTLEAGRRQLVSLRKTPPSMRCLFIERKKDAFKSLKSFSDHIAATTAIEARAERWDSTKQVDDVVSYVRERRDSFAFIFIDPKGYLGVRPKLIRPMLELPRAELLITLMSSFGSRFLGDPTKKLDTLVGARAAVMSELHGERREEAFVLGYQDRLREHFRYVCAAPVMDPERDIILYYLIYATRHKKGVSVFKQAEQIVSDKTHEIKSKLRARDDVAKVGDFFWAPTEMYPEPRRLVMLKRRNIAVARNRLIKLLLNAGKMSTEAAWLEAAQFAAVSLQDFRAWIAEWKKVEFIRLEPDTRLPRTESSDQVIVWTGLTPNMVIRD